MIIPGAGRLSRAALRIGRRFERKALILMYHRVARTGSDPWLLCVSPERFAEQLHVLRRRARPLRLRQLARAARDGSIPRRSVVVTFDDGYADNLHNAKPLLESCEVPATVFITSGFIGASREFWWEELDRIFLEPGTLPESLDLSIGGKLCHWELGEAARYDEETSRRNRRWKAWGEPDPTSRHLLFRSVYDLMFRLSPDDRRQVQDDLMAWAGMEPVARETRRSLSPEELSEMARAELIEIGAHTVTHRLLASATPPEQREEIRQSKADLERILNRPVNSFAYPYGRREDYTPETVELVKEAGFESACSNFGGVVNRGSDLYQLPRVHVQDIDGEEFSRQLDAWFES